MAKTTKKSVTPQKKAVSKASKGSTGKSVMPVKKKNVEKELPAKTSKKGTPVGATSKKKAEVVKPALKKDNKSMPVKATSKTKPTPVKSVKKAEKGSEKSKKVVSEKKINTPAAKSKVKTETEKVKSGKSVKKVEPKKSSNPAVIVKTAKGKSVEVKSSKPVKPVLKTSKSNEKPQTGKGKVSVSKEEKQAEVVTKKPKTIPSVGAGKKVEPEKAVNFSSAEEVELQVDLNIEEKGEIKAAVEPQIAPKVNKKKLQDTIQETSRPRPRILEFKRESRPTANPVFIVTPEGKAAVKFAPIAVVEKYEKSDKKESTEDMKTSPRFAFLEGDQRNGITIENKLRALYDVQLIDSRIDKLRATRGELPLEVEDLENEVAGLKNRVSRIQDEVAEVKNDIQVKLQSIKDAEAQIKKYKEQLDKVKNNREYESLNKEIEFQELEIQLLKKKIREGESNFELKNNAAEVAQEKLETRIGDLEHKRKQLDDIIEETKKEEMWLNSKSEEAKKAIDQRLLDAYERIRKGSSNGLAVVPIDRDSSAGSFIHIPPQKKMDVAARKKVIIDEHSGRILVDEELAREEQERIEMMISTDLK